MRRRAFTLIEVLLAMAILVALMTAFFVFFRGMQTAQAAARDMGNKQLAARTLCDMIERDLMCCIAGDGRLGPGVKGSDTELAILTRNTSMALAIHGYDDRQALSDIESARYTFSESDRNIEITREAPTLIDVPRTESETAPREPAVQPAAETLGPIERLRFRYFDGSTWHETFDSMQQNRLPVAVEVCMWLRPIPVVDEFGRPRSDADLREDVFNSMRIPEEEFAIIEDDNELSDPEFEEDDEENIPPPDVVRIVIIPDAVPVSRSGGAS